MSTSGGYIPSAADRAWIEANAAADRPGPRRDRGGRRTRRHPDPRPGVGARANGAGVGPAPDRRGRHRVRLFDAVPGAGPPADATIVTLDPDRSRTDLARGWWRQAGIAEERIVGRQPAGPRGFRGGADNPRSSVPSISRSSTRSRANTRPISRRSSRGCCPVRSSSRTTSCGRVACPGDKPARSGGTTEAIRAFDTAVLRDRALPGHDPAGRRRAPHRRVPRLAGHAAPDPPLRHPARAGGVARGRPRAPRRGDRRGRLERRSSGGSRSSRPDDHRSASPGTASTPTRIRP